MIDGFEDNASLHLQRDNILKNKAKREDIRASQKRGKTIFIELLDLPILEVLDILIRIQGNKFPISLKLSFVFLLLATKVS